LELLKGFGNFLLKELKELMRDPKIVLGMIIIPMVMFPALGGLMSFSIQSAQESAGKTVVIAINHDNGEESKQFISYLNNSLKIVSVNILSPLNVTDLMSKYNATVAIEIPADFSANVTSGLSARVVFYSLFSGSSIFGDLSSTILDGLVEQFNRQLSPNLVVQQKAVIIKGKVVEGIDPRILSSLMLSQAIAMPITIMILLSYSMQIAATSVAMEKEDKTLETLLTLPMDRFAILMGKLSGSIIVAGIGALAYMVGFDYYMTSLTSTFPTGSGVDLVSLGLVPSILGYLLLGISLFVTLLSALALAVIISAFTEDVRSAQSIVGYIYPLIFLPSLALMYLDINALPLAVRIILYAIPYSHPTIASKAVIMGDLWTVVLGIIYVTAFTLVVMYVASRLFATEKILTAKLRFKGFRRRKKTSEEA
jgi:ABC-2 type transport system permease protein